MHTFKYGKQPFRPDGRDLLFEQYRRATPLPPHPAQFGHEDAVKTWGILLNDSIGDCAVAGPMHMIELWTAAAGNPVTFTDANAMAAYSAISGYKPGHPETDVGCQLRDVLKYWRKTGFTDSTGKVHKIGAFLKINPLNLNGVEEAVYLLGAVNAGLMVPESMQEQFRAGRPFTVIRGSPIEGGHCMPVVALRDMLIASTWGAVHRMATSFYLRYYDEVWAIVSTDQLNGHGLSPEHFNLEQLNADLAAL